MSRSQCVLKQCGWRVFPLLVYKCPWYLIWAQRRIRIPYSVVYEYHREDYQSEPALRRPSDVPFTICKRTKWISFLWVAWQEIELTFQPGSQPKHGANLIKLHLPFDGLCLQRNIIHVVSPELSQDEPSLGAHARLLVVPKHVFVRFIDEYFFDLRYRRFGWNSNLMLVGLIESGNVYLCSARFPHLQTA